jgi:hypothetical protein
MVATPDIIQSTNTPVAASGENRVAVLLMGYGEVESYDDFANYNEQALNLLTAKFAPVPTWVYPPLAKLLAAFDLHEWSHQHGNFISPHNAIFEAQRAGARARAGSLPSSTTRTSKEPDGSVCAASASRQFSIACRRLRVGMTTLARGLFMRQGGRVRAGRGVGG